MEPDLPPLIWHHAGRDWNLNENFTWMRTNKDGTKRKGPPFLTIEICSRKARIKEMIKEQKKEQEEKDKENRLRKDAERKRRERAAKKKKKKEEDEKRLAEASDDLEQPDAAVPAAAAAAGNAPDGAAAVVAIDAPTSANEGKILSALAKATVDLMSEQGKTSKTVAAFMSEQGKTNGNITATIDELQKGQEASNTAAAAFMSEQTKNNGNVTTILQNHDGRIDDLQKGQEANTTEIATLKDSHGEVSGRVDGIQSKQESILERLKTIEKAKQYNAASIDVADHPGTRLSYGDESLDPIATPVKPPAAKGGRPDAAITPHVTPGYYYTSQAPTVVPPSSMKRPSTTVAAASGGGVPGRSPGMSSKLTKMEMDAIKTYSGVAYKVNDFMRFGVGLDKGNERLVALVRSALRKLPPHVGTVERGVDLSEQQLALMKAAQRDSTVFVERGFMSTTKQTLFDTKLANFHNKNCHMIIQSKSARSIKKYAKNSYKDEDEVLFAPDTKFLIKNVDSVSRPGKVVIMMEEV